MASAKEIGRRSIGEFFGTSFRSSIAFCRAATPAAFVCTVFDSGRSRSRLRSTSALWIRASRRFDRSELANASFRKARLCSAILANARIELTDFRGANLDQANVFGAQLRKAKLAGASMNELSENEPK